MASTTTCPSCDMANNPDFSYCVRCHIALPKTTYKVPSVVCQNCGTTNDTKFSYCIRCHAPLSKDNHVSEVNPSSPPSSPATLDPLPFPASNYTANGGQGQMVPPPPPLSSQSSPYSPPTLPRLSPAYSWSPGYQPPPSPSAPPRRRRKGVVVATVAFAIILVLVVGMWEGVIPSLPPFGGGSELGATCGEAGSSGTSSGAQISYCLAHSIANGKASATQGGPWTLVSAGGISSSYKENVSCGIVSETVPPQQGNLTSGLSVFWQLSYLNYRGSALIVYVVRGSVGQAAVVSGSLVTSGGCSLSVPTERGINATVIDSTNALNKADTTLPSGSSLGYVVYVLGFQYYKHATPDLDWFINYGTCYTGNYQDEQFLDATTGTLLGGVASGCPT